FQQLAGDRTDESQAVRHGAPWSSVRGHAGRRFWWCNYGVALLGQFGCCCLVVVVLPNCGVDGRSERSRSRNHGGVSVEKRKHILGRTVLLTNRTERPVAFCGFSQASITGTVASALSCSTS
ncbi:MAG: hypothetical protein QOE94_3076, partial [Mycobacterium sp.]|nr:hypothetical protein [Mycobacterium sp.]